MQPVPDPVEIKRELREGETERVERSTGDPEEGVKPGDTAHGDPLPTAPSAPVPDNNMENSLYKTRFGRIVKPVVKYHS